MDRATGSENDIYLVPGPVVPGIRERNQPPLQWTAEGAVSFWKSQNGERGLRKKGISCPYIEFQKRGVRGLRSEEG